MDFSAAFSPPSPRSAHLLFQVRQGVLEKETHRDAGMRTNLCEKPAHTTTRREISSSNVFIPNVRTHLKAAIRAESPGSQRAALLCAVRRCRNAFLQEQFDSLPTALTAAEAHRNKTKVWAEQKKKS